MTETEHNPDQAEQAHKFPVHDHYDAHPDSGFDWHVVVVFELEAGRVAIQDRCGDSMPIREWNGVDIRLATAKGGTFASMTPVVTFLESDRAQAMLADLAEGHRVEWDGSNHVGRLTQDALDARYTLEEKLQGIFEHLPTYWTAENWFAHGDHGLSGRETDDDLADRVAAEMSRACPHYLQAADVLRYLTEKRAELAAEQAEQEPECLLVVQWYEGPELAGWHVEVLRRDENGDLFVATDSEKVAFPVNVDRFQRNQRAALVAELLAAFPGATVRA